MIEEWKFTELKINEFRQWLNLVDSDLTWTNSQKEIFDSFWLLAFRSPNNLPMNLKQVHEKLEQLEAGVVSGTLAQWLRWLRNRLNCYVFIFENINLRDLALDSDYRINDLAYILRDFFISEYPDYRLYFDKYFNVGNHLSENLYISFQKIQQFSGLKKHSKCLNHSSMMNSLEVPFFEDFEVLLEKSIRREKKWRFKKPIKKMILFKAHTIKYMLGIFFLVFIILFGFSRLSDWYQRYLSEKISLSIPVFYDENLLNENWTLYDRQKDKKHYQKELKLSFDHEDRLLGTRSETESDMIVTSLDELPKNIKKALYDSSDYEEAKRGGFRDYRYGRSRAYRLFINTYEPHKTRKQVESLLSQAPYKKVDNIPLGKKIPGGHYYNVYLANTEVKSFFKAFEESGKVYISKTPRPGPRGMSHLFIWVKKI